MTVVRYEPWSLVNRFQRDIDRLFGAPQAPLRRIPAHGCRPLTFTRRTIGFCCMWTCRASIPKRWRSPPSRGC